MRISDWSSDVCSSDLRRLGARLHGAGGSGPRLGVARSHRIKTVRRRFRSRDFCNLRWLCALQHCPIERSDRMADDRNEVGVPDRARINLREDYEIRDWKNSLGVKIGRECGRERVWTRM